MSAPTPPPSRGGIRIKTIRLVSPADLAGWSVALDALSRRTGRLYFASTEWLAAWWRVLEPGSEVTLHLAHREASLAGWFATARVRRRLHPRVPLTVSLVVNAGAGKGAADHTGPVAEDPATCAALLNSALTEAAPDSVLLSSLAPGVPPVLGPAGGRVLSTRRCPGIGLEGVVDPADLWDRKFRKELRRRRRRLEEAGFAQEWMPLDSSSEPALRSLQRLHISRWNSRGGAGLFDEERLRFLLALGSPGQGRVEGEGGWIQLVRGAEGTVGGLLGFRFGSTFCSYKTGWDPTRHELGLGVLMHTAAVERAMADGLGRYEFLRGTEAHKYSLGGRDEVDSTVLVTRGIGGRAYDARERLVARRDRRRSAST